MPAGPACSCGYTREEWNGILICRLHCDGPSCQSKCARCRTYDAVMSKRISA